MQRRDFVKGIAGAATVWSLAASAQEPERRRRIGVLTNRVEDDAEGQAAIVAFRQALAQLGWYDGRNVQIDVAWAAGDAELERKYAGELVALRPDVVLASGTMGMAAVQQVTRSLPIVFVMVSDPVGAGFVDSVARPGGNITGFMNFEYSLVAKWPELLRTIAPNLMRVAIVKNPVSSVDSSEFGVIQAVSQSLRMEVTPINLRDDGEIESAIEAFAGGKNGGLIVESAISASVHRKRLIALAAKHKLPAIYANRADVVDGGLMTYGPDRVEELRGAAGYVDRIFKGEKPADLPVQAPTKYELILNLKTAKSLGLNVPSTLLATAGEVIE